MMGLSSHRCRHRSRMPSRRSRRLRCRGPMLERLCNLAPSACPPEAGGSLAFSRWLCDVRYSIRWIPVGRGVNNAVKECAGIENVGNY
jgi:hypothetical protein